MEPSSQTNSNESHQNSSDTPETRRLFIAFSFSTTNQNVENLLTDLNFLANEINPNTYKTWSKGPLPTSSAPTLPVDPPSPNRSPSPKPRKVNSLGRAKMSPSDIIYKRILHDPNFDQEEFIVAWEDRFDGNIPQPFNDYDPKTIPFHRVRYFKQCGIRVWDRDLKFDYLTNGYPEKISKMIEHRRSNPKPSETQNMEKDTQDVIVPPVIHKPSIQPKSPKSNKHGLKLNVFRKEFLHMTLVFLGNTDVKNIKHIDTILTNITQGTNCPNEGQVWSHPIQGIDGFRNLREPFVLFLKSARKYHAMYNDLVKEIQTSLQEKSIPFDNKRQKFHPHITVSRVKMPKKKKIPALTSQIQISDDPLDKLGILLQKYYNSSFGEIRCNSIDLWETTKDGYVCQQKYPFKNPVIPESASDLKVDLKMSSSDEDNSD